MGKEQSTPDNIPGVSRGKNFFSQGRSIEATRETWASRKRAFLLEDSVSLLLIEKDRGDYFLELPVLGQKPEIEGPAAVWIPRVDPISGAVITSRIVSNFDKSALGSGEYTAVGGKRYSPDINLASVPKSWSVSLIVPQTVPDGIEAAMRQQDEIIYTYSPGKGAEHGKVEEVFSEIYLLSEAFARGEVKTEADFGALAERAQTCLVRNGLLDAHHPIWKKISGYTQRAASKDSLNRLNPMVSRILARAAYLAAVEREVIGINIKNKAQRTFSYLQAVRLTTRFEIEQSALVLSELCGFGGEKAENRIFRERRDSMTVREGWEIGQVVKAVSEGILKDVRPAPYLFPATLARLTLTGESFYKTKAESNLIRDIVKAGGVKDVSLGASAEDYLRVGFPELAREKIRHAYGLLKAVLFDKANFVTTVF
jgi:hypothetical protein